METSRKRLYQWIAAVSAVITLAVVGWILAPNLYEVLPPSGNLAVDATREATRSQAVVTTRASVLAALAGLGALVTIAINYRNSAIANRNVEVANRNTEIAAETLAITNRTFGITARGHLTDRYTKAIEQLGNADSPAIQLGGIYALQQFAVETDRAEDQTAAVEVLSAFVRNNLPAHTLSFAIGLERSPIFEADVGVLPQQTPAHLTDLVRVYAKAPGPRQPGQRVPPRPSRPSVEPSVLAAISVLAQLPDRIALRADFSEASFSGVPLMQARLSGANLREVELVMANLSRTDLIGANLSGATLYEATLSLSDLRDADLAGAYLDGAYLTRANLAGAVLTRARLVSGTLDAANLVNANLIRANLVGADLTSADLAGANLTTADLTGADLTGADLTNTVLRDARLVDANLTGAVLSGADFTDADLGNVRFNPSQLSPGQRATARNVPDEADAEPVNYLQDP